MSEGLQQSEKFLIGTKHFRRVFEFWKSTTVSTTTDNIFLHSMDQCFQTFVFHSVNICTQNSQKIILKQLLEWVLLIYLNRFIASLLRTKIIHKLFTIESTFLIQIHFFASFTVVKFSGHKSNPQGWINTACLETLTSKWERNAPGDKMRKISRFFGFYIISRVFSIVLECPVYRVKHTIVNYYSRLSKLKFSYFLNCFN